MTGLVGSESQGLKPSSSSLGHANLVAIPKKLAMVLGAVVLALVVVVIGLAVALGSASRSASRAEVPRNLILFVTDGMGPATATACRTGGRVLKKDPTFTLFADGIHVGSSRTASLNSPVTDSAAGGTAIATGQRTWNGFDSVEVTDGKFAPQGSILEAAMIAGKAVGVISTTDITDATPAAFTAHAIQRTLGELIAAQQAGKGIHVMMGGGRKWFTQRSDGRDLLKELKAKGYSTPVDTEGMRASPAGAPMIALFANATMAFEMDRVPSEQPSLQEMTEKALEILKATPQYRSKGLLLVVEAARIDHAGHSNDIAANVRDCLAWNDAMGAAMRFQNETASDTLIFSTSDHDTGGLSLGGGTIVAKGTSQNGWMQGTVGAGDPTKVEVQTSVDLTTNLMVTLSQTDGDYVFPYDWVPWVVMGVNKSAEWVQNAIKDKMVAKGMARLTDPELLAITTPALGFALSEVELAIFRQAMDTAVTRIWNKAAAANLTASERDYGPYILQYAVNAAVSRRSNVGWSSKSHTGVDVAVYAKGPGAAKLGGNRQNNEHARIIAEVMGLDLKAATEKYKDVDVGVCPYTDGRCPKPYPTFTPPIWGRKV